MVFLSLQKIHPHLSGGCLESSQEPGFSGLHNVKRIIDFTVIYKSIQSIEFSQENNAMALRIHDNQMTVPPCYVQLYAFSRTALVTRI